SSTGTLTNGSGLPVLTTDGAPVSIPPNADLTLGDDGTITAATPGQPPTTLGKLKLITPTADDPIKRGADGLFRTTTGDPANTDPNARLQTGVVEGSNVNAVETMVAMIQTGRQFENQMQLLQNAESNDKSATALLSVQ
ncbi:MAG: flagellar biosynthesis protein FlgF, partial [Curvibacter sp.]|nr:flagellar biosynthesis protein FlgF [Curvibacter sp.]